jgi:hypothetical protein
MSGSRVTAVLSLVSSSAARSGGVADFTTTVLAPAVVAAIISATVVLVGLWISGRRAEVVRKRELFAKAFEATVGYREFAYAIRRRRHDQPAAERVRLSEAIRETQQQLAFYSAWIEIESPHVAGAYDELVLQTRQMAGQYMRDAWNERAPRRDSQVNIPGGLDYTTLRPFEQRYLAAVRDHLSPWRPFLERRLP